MSLTTSLLTGSNYLTWSKSIKIALGAKTKLGFIDEKCSKPEEKDSKYNQLLKVDCMVRSWILNSFSKDFVEAFLYVNTAKELWDEVKERYGECNGPVLYQIQREISTVTQGDTIVAQYYTKLKRHWDELNCLTPVPQCTCVAAKLVADTFDSTRLIQFLMGLNDAYDSVRGQILLMEPLPMVNRAYSTVLLIEKQREVNQSYVEVQENSAFLVKTSQTNFGRGKGIQGRGRGTQGQNSGRGRGRSNDKNAIFCDYCNTSGHTRDTCFQLVGNLEWYQQLKSQRENAIMVKPEASKTYFDHSKEPATKQDSVANMLMGYSKNWTRLKEN